MSSSSEYMVGPTIGQGSFAHVVYAVHKPSGRTVAIKVVEQLSIRKHPWLLQTIMTEKKILQSSDSNSNEKKVSRPAWVVSLWAAFYDAHHLYMVMELCSGGDLEGLLSQAGMLQEEEEEEEEDSDEKLDGHRSLSSVQRERWIQHSVPFYASQIVNALQYLHSKIRILHCDLKPSNCLLQADTGQLRLCDFGSAIEMDRQSTTKTTAAASDSSSDSSNRNRTWIPRGTTEYSCPEIIRATSPLALNEGVDYWSVGCLLYAMIHAGKSPFCHDSEALTVQAMKEHCQGRIGFHHQQLKPTDKHTRNFQEWLGLSIGLLREDPEDRIQFWEENISRHDLLQWDPAAVDRGDVILPRPHWKDEVENAVLKDGNEGWTAFVQL
ncbi:serine/threonine protein kinase [Nitzschia inconspicua]|uniref:non-specific serine/threonine protein kinase n=1 Tax=Nitzschia inconspicua TaxID=303405 RepID=A0A9K3LIS5_9STRA|nr:serine/threonine protein kinase [Nitzschia inconspicua]